MSDTQQVTASGRAAETSALMQRLLRFQGPPDQFLGELLNTQCRLGQAAAGSMVRLTLNEPEAAPPAMPETTAAPDLQASDAERDADASDTADASAAASQTAVAPADADADTGPDAQTREAPPVRPPVQAEVMAIYPPSPSKGTAPSWLAHAIELALQYPPGGGSHVHRLQVSEPVIGGPTAHHLIVVPVQTEHGFQGIQAFLIDSDDDLTVQARRQRIELSVSLLSLYEMRQVLQRREADLMGLSTATRVLSAGNEHSRFKGAAMAVANELASRWRAERVSVGLLSGRYVKLKAMSQTEHLSRKMAMVQDIEAAMEECLDQDVEVIHPAPPEATVVNRAAGELSTRHGPATVCSLPLRRGEEVVGVVSFERDPADPFTIEEISFLRMACDLVTPRLVELGESDQWFGARWARSAQHAGAVLVGPKHTWAKLLAVALMLGAVALAVVPGTVRVEAPFKFQAITQRSIPAPFDGYLQTVEVEPNDLVIQGDVLATLDTAELRAERSRLDAERIAFEKEGARAAREGNQVDRQIAEAQRDNIAAQLNWTDWQIAHAVIRAPLDGTVVAGDLTQQLGAPVGKGDVLFEVAPLNALRAELLVDDHKISDVPGVGAAGWLAAAAQPDQKLPFAVEVIHPIAEVVDGRNVFRVRVKLNESRPWTRPGIEGVAKVDAWQAPIGWVWTRDAVNWVRMKLWI